MKFNWKLVFKLILSTLILLAISLTSYYLFTGFLGREKIEQLVQDLGIFGPLLIILLKSSTIIIAPLGGNPVYIASSLIYGILPAFIYTFIGDVFGHIISFWLARRFGSTLVGKVIGEKSIGTINNYYEKFGGWRLILASGLLGLTDIVSYFAGGLTNISFSTFSLIMILMRIPTNLIFVSLAYIPEYSVQVKAIYGLAAISYLLFIGFFFYKELKNINQIKGGN